MFVEALPVPGLLSKVDHIVPNVAKEIISGGRTCIIFPRPRLCPSIQDSANRQNKNLQLLPAAAAPGCPAAKLSCAVAAAATLWLSSSLQTSSDTRRFLHKVRNRRDRQPVCPKHSTRLHTVSCFDIDRPPNTSEEPCRVHGEEGRCRVQCAAGLGVF